MMQMVAGALLVIIVVMGAMWLNTTAPAVLAFMVGFGAGVMVTMAVGLWLFAKPRGGGE